MGEEGEGTTRAILSYVLSRIGQIRSVDRSVRGCWLYGGQNRGGWRRRSRISVEGVVDQSRLRNTLAAVPESARRRADYLREEGDRWPRRSFSFSLASRDKIAFRTPHFRGTRVISRSLPVLLCIVNFFRVSQRGEDGSISRRDVSRSLEEGRSGGKSNAIFSERIVVATVLALSYWCEVITKSENLGIIIRSERIIVGHFA